MVTKECPVCSEIDMGYGCACVTSKDNKMKRKALNKKLPRKRSFNKSASKKPHG